MTLASKLTLSFAGLALVAFGAALWARYGSLVYFDMLQAWFVGCFF